MKTNSETGKERKRSPPRPRAHLSDIINRKEEREVLPNSETGITEEEAP